MIQKVIKTNKQQQTIIVDIVCQPNIEICLQVDDVYKPRTTYTHRCIKPTKGTYSFFIRMPQSPEAVILRMWNNKSKNAMGFNIKEIKEDRLNTKLSAFDYKNPLIQNFVKFAQEFCENAGILDYNNAIYMSDEGDFRIDYLPTIRDRKTGRQLDTPSRISKSRGIIEVAADKFLTYTIPMRIAILLHEFSHFFLNKNQDNEHEADMNALLIYLGLGYSRSEAKKVFLKVFMNTPSDVNMQRYEETIEKVINNFDKNNFKLFSSSSYNYKGER